MGSTINPARNHEVAASSAGWTTYPARNPKAAASSAAGSVSPSPLSPTDVGAGGFQRLTPSGNAGVALGPLGSPPSDYSGPGPLPGVAAGAGSRVLSSGGFGVGAESGLGGLTSNGAGVQGGPSSTSGAGTAGANGAGGYPFMPPMTGAGAGSSANEKERERTTWLTEDEEVWGTEPDVVSAVVGRDEVPEGAPAEPARRPSPPRTPAGPQQPARTGQSRGRREA
jgi:hypothetical protein